MATIRPTNNDFATNPNSLVTKPDDAYLDRGFTLTQPPVNFFNWIIKNLYQWARYLDEQSGQGDVFSHTYTSTVQLIEIPFELSGDTDTAKKAEIEVLRRMQHGIGGNEIGVGSQAIGVSSGRTFNITTGAIFTGTGLSISTSSSTQSANPLRLRASSTFFTNPTATQVYEALSQSGINVFSLSGTNATGNVGYIDNVAFNSINKNLEGITLNAGLSNAFFNRFFYRKSLGDVAQYYLLAGRTSAEVNAGNCLVYRLAGNSFRDDPAGLADVAIEFQNANYMFYLLSTYYSAISKTSLKDNAGVRANSANVVGVDSANYYVHLSNTIRKRTLGSSVNQGNFSISTTGKDLLYGTPSVGSAFYPLIRRSQLRSGSNFSFIAYQDIEGNTIYVNKLAGTESPSSPGGNVARGTRSIANSNVAIIVSYGTHRQSEFQNRYTISFLNSFTKIKTPISIDIDGSAYPLEFSYFYTHRSVDYLRLRTQPLSASVRVSATDLTKDINFEMVDNEQVTFSAPLSLQTTLTHSLSSDTYLRYNILPFDHADGSAIEPANTWNLEYSGIKTPTHIVVNGRAFAISKRGNSSRYNGSAVTDTKFQASSSNLGPWGINIRFSDGTYFNNTRSYLFPYSVSLTIMEAYDTGTQTRRQADDIELRIFGSGHVANTDVLAEGALSATTIGSDIYLSYVMKPASAGDSRRNSYVAKFTRPAPTPGSGGSTITTRFGQRLSSLDISYLRSFSNWGLISDGTTLWLASQNTSSDRSSTALAYTASTRERDSSKDIALGATSFAWTGAVSDGTTGWFIGRNLARAWNLSTQTRDTTMDFTFTGNGEDNGVSDGNTIWFLFPSRTVARAYTASNRQRDSSKDINLGTGRWNGGFSDGTTLWFVDTTSNYARAYTASNRQRDSSKDINLGTGVGGGAFAANTFWLIGRTAIQAYSSRDISTSNPDKRILSSVSSRFRVDGTNPGLFTANSGSLAKISSGDSNILYVASGSKTAFYKTTTNAWTSSDPRFYNRNLAPIYDQYRGQLGELKHFRTARSYSGGVGASINWTGRMTWTTNPNTFNFTGYSVSVPRNGKVDIKVDLSEEGTGYIDPVASGVTFEKQGSSTNTSYEYRHNIYTSSTDSNSVTVGSKEINNSIIGRMIYYPTNFATSAIQDRYAIAINNRYISADRTPSKITVGGTDLNLSATLSGWTGETSDNYTWYYTVAVSNSARRVSDSSLTKQIKIGFSDNTELNLKTSPFRYLEIQNTGGSRLINLDALDALYSSTDNSFTWPNQDANPTPSTATYKFIFSGNQATIQAYSWIHLDNSKYSIDTYGAGLDAKSYLNIPFVSSSPTTADVKNNDVLLVRRTQS